MGLTQDFFTPTSYDVNEHQEFLNLTLYLNDYQKKIREGASREALTRGRTRNETRDRGFDLDYKSYTCMKAMKSFNPYKTDQRACKIFNRN